MLFTTEYFQGLFSKNKSILLHDHNIVIEFREFSIH